MQEAARKAWEGVPDLPNSHRGDLIVELALETPTNLSPRQQELLREFLRSQEEAASQEPLELPREAP